MGRETFPKTMDVEENQIMQKNERDGVRLVESNMTTSDTVKQQAVETLVASGEACSHKNQLHEALLHFTKATLLAPNHVQALTSCSRVLLAMARPAEAALYSEKALALDPNGRTLSAHGQALYQLGNFTEALTCFERIITEEPDNYIDIGHHALCLTQFNRYDEALLTYQKALVLSTNNALIQTNFAFSLLATGDLLVGFKALEWRWQAQLLSREREWSIPSSNDLGALQGKSILIHTEQGLGDNIQFFRYIPMLVELGAHVFLEIQPSLIPLFYPWQNKVTFLGAGSTLPVCDYHCPIMSLAHVFQTDIHNIPSPIPYIMSDARQVEALRKTLKNTHRKRIGIAWRGSHLNQLNYKRSIALTQLLAIHHNDFDFVCLQLDITIDEKKLLDQYNIPYYSLELSTFEGTAALISCLDLVVTIDTSIAHLAGAMGKPVWILLAFNSDWRWLLNREDSPWYPTARLFRQAMIGDWSRPLTEIKASFSGLNDNSGIQNRMRQAVQSLQETSFIQAEQLFQSVLIENPNYHSALQGLGLIAFQQNNLSRAIYFMQRAAQMSPATPLYHRNVGELLRRNGQLDAAISAHKVAVDLEPDSAENHYHLGLALNDNQQYEQAITSYRAALSCNLNHGLAWNNLGASLERIGDTVGAKAAYTTAITLNPVHAEAQNNLGVICTEQGHLQDACIHFEAAISAKPDFVEAHSNLSALKTYTKDDPHLRMLRALKEKMPFLSENERIHYHFALGKALDDIGQFAPAFESYAEGNRLQYTQDPWDDTRLKIVCQQIPHVFTPSFLKKPRKTRDTRRIIFIVGMPRSGTTLIEQILSSHECVYGAGELSILDEVIHSARGAAPNIPFTTWASQLTNKEFVALGNAYKDRTWALAPDKDYITDKMPGNCFYIGMIYRMLPDAKIIHAMRDPMDSCFSCFTHLFNQSMPFSYAQDALGRYYRFYAQIMQYWHAVLPKGTILDLPYESMVANHEAQAKRLLDYIGLPWDSNCLNFYNNERLVKTASMAQVRKPIYNTSVKRWEFFADELQTLLGLVGPYRATTCLTEAPL